MQRSELYVNTTEETTDYMVKTMKYYGADVKNATKDLIIPFPKPGDSPEAGWIVQLNEIYKSGKYEVDPYVGQRSHLKVT